MALKASLAFMIALFLLASTMDATYPPKCPPTEAPAKPLACVPRCEEYCKTHPSHLHIKECMKACTGCCEKYECVPTPTQKCPVWDVFINKHGHKFTCP